VIDTIDAMMMGSIFLNIPLGLEALTGVGPLWLEGSNEDGHEHSGTFTDKIKCNLRDSSYSLIISVLCLIESDVAFRYLHGQGSILYRQSTRQ
jgi:hypothetical protein